MQRFKPLSTARVRSVQRTPGPLWQRGYYEHIVRDHGSLERIRDYIVNNPSQWNVDPENPGAVPDPTNASELEPWMV